ncbi:hypothetical protein BUZ28_11815 [Staphylococcus borealis]|nr:hypothetical protein BUZ28_11815 [Staphylococcus borealis]RIO69789.1 hypothetical protein BUZ17_10225 [Staphylococcus borealis]
MILQAEQIGVGAPTKRISLRNSTSKASWEWGPNKENFIKKFYKQNKLGVDDEFERILSRSLF